MTPASRHQTTRSPIGRSSRKRSGLPPIILASSSARRRALLRQIGLPFKAVPARIEEVYRGEPPETFARRMSALKAAKVSSRHKGFVVIGADTIVVLGRQVLGKPKDPASAVAMAKALSGRVHRVITGVTVRKDAKEFTGAETTRVKFRPLRSEVISHYVESGEPMDKAGAYGIQGRGILLVDRIEGCYTNVVGLPLGLLSELLERLGVRLP